MKIDVRQIPAEGIVLREAFAPRDLDLETEIVRFKGPVNVQAQVSRIANAVTVHLNVSGRMRLSCSRCLNDFETEFRKDVVLNYPVSGSDVSLELDPDIREEIIIDYPIKPLCKNQCKGLCPRCGMDLNEGACACG